MLELELLSQSPSPPVETELAPVGCCGVTITMPCGVELPDASAGSWREIRGFWTAGLVALLMLAGEIAGSPSDDSWIVALDTSAWGYWS